MQALLSWRVNRVRHREPATRPGPEALLSGTVVTSWQGRRIQFSRRGSHAATRRAAGAQPDRPDPPPGVRAPDPARPRRRRRGSGRRRTSRRREECSSSSTAASSTSASTWSRCGPTASRSSRSTTRLRRRGTTSRGGRDRRGDARAASTSSTRAPSSTAPGAARPTSCSASTKPSDLRRLVLRDRRHQARPQAEGRRAAADGHLRRAAHRAAGRGAGVHPRRHRRRRLAAVAAGRRRRLRPPRAGPAGGVRRRRRRPPSPRRSATASSAAGPRGAPPSCGSADDLGLVAGMRGDQRDALRAVGIATLAAAGRRRRRSC